jgi:hypothetical protein
MDKVTDRTNVRALSQGINLTEIKSGIPELEALCNHKIEASENFKNAIQIHALKAGLLPGVLSQYITARCTDSVKKKARSAEQLSFLFGEEV